MSPEFYSITLAILAAGAAGLVGAFALMKRTILAGDVMSHIAIPGLGLALMWHFNPIIGGALTLLLGALVISQLERKATISSEAAIGVIFAASVALGALLINSKEELIDALFGGLGSLSWAEFTFGIVAAAFIMVSLWILRNKLIINFFSSELAAATGVNLGVLNFFFLILFSLSILLGLRFLGALLAGALIIVPASAARQLTHSLSLFLGCSVLLSIVSMAVGLAASSVYGLQLGPTVVIVSSLVFLLSLLKTKR